MHAIEDGFAYGVFCVYDLFRLADHFFGHGVRDEHYAVTIAHDEIAGLDAARRRW